MRIVAISDLHLGVGERRSPTDPPEGFLHDVQLAGFIAHLSHDWSEPTALLLLGDIFELPGGFLRSRRRPGHLIVELADLVERVERIADAHSEVFAAFADFVASGGTIHIVPGNHDPALAIPEVGEALVSVIAAAGCAVQSARAQLTIHPGALHLAGELHAQHGNQLHDLNAFASPAQPYRGRGRSSSFLLEDPLGSVLHRLQLAPRSWEGLLFGLVELSNFFLAIPAMSLRAWKIGASSGDHPEAIALRPMFASGTLAAVRRVARRRLLRASDRRITEHYMVGGARQLDAAMRAANHGVPVYLFGHSHRAACRSLGPDGPLYVNTGTWSVWAPPDQPSLPYVEITTGPETPVVTIRYWSTGQETVSTS